MDTSIRSLIVAPHWIGDAVMSEPLLRRLHERGEMISVAAVPWVLPIYSEMPFVTELIELPFQHGKLQLTARRTLARQIKGQFDRAYVLPNSLKSALLPWFSRIPKRIGYVGEMRYRLINKPLRNPPKKLRPAMVKFYNALSGETDLCTEKPQLQQDENLVKATLSAFDLDGIQPIIMVPGAEYGQAKRWPAKHFANLALELDQTKTLVLLGSERDKAVCQDIISMIRAHQSKLNCLNLAGQSTLAQAMALIAACEVLIGNDSGLMHIAAALDVPQIAIFGSSSPLYTPPLSDKAHVLWLKNDPNYQPSLDCSPCFKKTCPFGHTRCLNDIKPELVFDVYKNL